MKTLHIQKYRCPCCHKKYTCEEWSEPQKIKESICDICLESTTPFSFFVPYSPPWKKYEKDMWNTDFKHSSKATDRFIAEREHEVKTDPRAARWEQSRKARWAKNKPEWVKRQGGR